MDTDDAYRESVIRWMRQVGLLKRLGVDDPREVDTARAIEALDAHFDECDRTLPPELRNGMLQMQRYFMRAHIRAVTKKESRP